MSVTPILGSDGSVLAWEEQSALVRGELDIMEELDVMEEFDIAADSTASVGGTLFEDLDGDGVRDPGEGGLKGWTAELQRIGTGDDHLQSLMSPLAEWGRFGESVAFLGNDVLVTAREDDTAAIDGGAVYLFDGTIGQPLRTFLSPEPSDGAGFGTSVTTLGNDVLIGGERSSAAYLFDGATGELLQTFNHPSGSSWGFFGGSVAAVGDNVLIGASGESQGAAYYVGAAYLFDGATGELLQTFENPDPDSADQFGSSLAVVGDNILIGASYDDHGAENAGAVYLFDGATGELMQSFYNPDPVSYGRFGTYLAAVGDNFVVGSQGNSLTYLIDGNTGGLLQTFQHRGPVAAVGNHVLIGDSLYDGTTGELLQTFLNPNPGHYGFGHSVATDGDEVLIVDFNPADHTGRVYRFDAGSFTTTTDAEGNYDFNDVTPGTYRVRQVPADGYRQTTPQAGGSYTITVSGGENLSGHDFGNVQSGDNTAPVAVDDRYTTEEDSALWATVGVLANDTGNGPLSAVLIADPSHGTLLMEADGSFRYTPNEDFYGTDSFTYKATDGQLDSEAATVVITVNPVHEGALGGTVYTDQNQSGLRDSGEGVLKGWTVQLQRIGTSGEPLQVILNPLAESNRFGEAVEFLGDHVLVTAPDDDTAAIDAGAVYLFDGDSGDLLHTFLSPDARERGGFGKSLATIGDNVLIGSESSNAAYLFDGATGELLQTFNNPDGADWQYFGGSVAAVGDNVLIGAGRQHYGNSVYYAGAAYLFDGTTGELIHTLLNPDPDTYDRFGYAVTAVGGNILVGSPYDDYGAENAGSAYLFDGTTGELLKTFHNPDPSWYAQFGGHVTAVGGNFLVGSGTYSNYDARPATYLFDGSTGEILQKFADQGPIAAVGGDILIGEKLYDGSTGELLETFENPNPGRYGFGHTVASNGDDVLIVDYNPADHTGRIYRFHAGFSQTTTGAEGQYSFTDVEPGTYRVQQLRGEGYTQTQPDDQVIYTITIAADENHPGNDFGNVWTGLDDAPVAADDHYTTTEDTVLETGDGVLANDNDTDGDALSAVLVAGPSHGTLLLESDGSFRYTPQNDFHGTDGFTYKARAGGLDSEVATVLIDVEAVADGSAGGTVFQDLNGNGVRDEGERGLAGRTVELLRVNVEGERVQAFVNPLAEWGRFGESVALFGDNVLVGAPDDDTADVDAGAVYMFDRTSGELLHTFLSPEARQRGGFGKSVATVGGNILIGSENDSTAHLFNGTTGELLQTFELPNGQNWYSFGSSVAAVGDNFLIGAPRESQGATYYIGAAYLFDGTSGELIRTIANPDPDTYDSFGSAIAAVGDNFLVGAPNDDYGAESAGSVYLFDGTTGELLKTLHSPDPLYYGSFGAYVEGFGDDFLVGTSYRNTAYLFDGTTGEILLTFDHRGAIAAAGDNLLIGDRLYDGTTGDLLRTFSNPDPGRYGFGRSVDADANSALIADALQTDHAGRVYLFGPGSSGDVVTVNTDADGNYDFGELKPGTYRVRQLIGEGYTRTRPDGDGTYTITITAEESLWGLDFGNYRNFKPVAENDAHHMDQDGTLTVTAVAGLLANDSDENGDSLSVLMVDDPEHGTLTLASDGSFVYTPDDGYAGTDSFTYKASDGEEYSNVATVSITVKLVDPVNEAPMAEDDSYFLMLDHEDGHGNGNGNGDHGNENGNDDHGNENCNGDHGNENGNDDHGNENGNDDHGNENGNDDHGNENGNDDHGNENGNDDHGNENGNDDHGNENGNDDHGNEHGNDDHGNENGNDDHGNENCNGDHGNENGNGDHGNENGNDDHRNENGNDDHGNENGNNDHGNENGNDDDERNALTVTSEAGVLANDSDDDGDSLEAVLVDGPTHGSVTLAADGSFVYTADDDYAGTDSFTYKASDGLLESNLATVTVTVARDLGRIHVVELPHLNPAAGDIWYAFSTTRDALITLWAQDSDDVTITLYDENLNEVAEWIPGDGNQRIEWPAEEGRNFYFRLSGTDDDVNVHLANVIKLDDGQATMFGTDGDDVFEVAVRDLLGATDANSGDAEQPIAPIVVTINGVEYTVDSGDVTSLTFDGGGGDDRVVIRGSAGDDTIRLRPFAATVIGLGYHVEVTSTSDITVIAGGGNDVAHLFDSAGDDVFVARPEWAEMRGEGFRNRVEGISTVHGYAKAGGNDVAHLYDSTGDDTFIGRPAYSKLSGDGFLLRAKSFDMVHAYGKAGGTDVAHLFGSRGDDTFVGKSTFGKLWGDGFFNRAKLFDYVHGYARQGGTDVAHLYDSSGNDKFVAGPKYGKLFGDGFFNRAKFFDYVHGYARHGGTDTAYLYDSAGDDTLVATPEYAKLFGQRFYNRAKFFDNVYAFGNQGGHDAARLFDSAGDDRFVVDESGATLSGDGFNNRARAFDSVTAISNHGGRDEAVLNDTGRQNHLEATGLWARLL